MPNQKYSQDPIYPVREVKSVNSMWACTAGDVKSLCDFMSSDTVTALFKNLFQDNASMIVGIMQYPFAIPTESEYSYFKIGNQRGPFQCKKPTSLMSPKISYTIDIPGSGNFLGYEPYSQYDLYIPFIGLVPLKARDILGLTLDLDYYVDYQTGKADVYVTCYDPTFEVSRHRTIYHGECQIGVSYPFGMTDANMKAFKFVANTIKNIATMGAGMALDTGTTRNIIERGPETVSSTYQTNPKTGRAVLQSKTQTTGGQREIVEEIPARSQVPNAINALVNLPERATGLTTAGGTVTSFAQPLLPYLIVYRIDLETPDSYGYFYGYPDFEEGLISDFTGDGYIECSAVQLVSDGTVGEEEMVEIEKWLKEGIIV